MRQPLPVEEVELEGSASDPLSESLRRADLAALWAAITALPQQQREALLLREFGGLAYDELAAALGVSGAAVESLLFRARTRLRGQLEAAFASLSGAGWISALQDVVARLATTSGAAKIGSIPVVAKAVTAGVGIAVVAGGTVVGEHQGGSRRGPSRPVPLVAAARPAVTPIRVVATATIAPPVLVSQHIRAVAATSQNATSSGSDGKEHASSDGESSRSASAGHDAQEHDSHRSTRQSSSSSSSSERDHQGDETQPVQSPERSHGDGASHDSGDGEHARASEHVHDSGTRPREGDPVPPVGDAPAVTLPAVATVPVGG
jgi:hypothetical protein